MLAGQTELREELPPALRTGPPAAIFFEVELLNEHGRSAGASTPVYVAAGQAPPAVDQLTLLPRKAGMLLRWTPLPEPGAQVRVERELVGETPGSPAEQAATKTRSGDPERGRPKGATHPAGQAPPASVVLTTDLPGGSPGAQHDAGGLLDPTVLDGGTYRYTARRVLHFHMAGQGAGHAAGGDLELVSESSAPATAQYRQVFAPEAPEGLVAAAGGGFGFAASIDLSWEPAQEADVVGYNVYRAPAPRPTSGPAATRNADRFIRLNAVPVGGPAFRDRTVRPGDSFRYRVTAVDSFGNESRPSAAVDATVPAADTQ